MRVNLLKSHAYCDRSAAGEPVAAALCNHRGVRAPPVAALGSTCAGGGGLRVLRKMFPTPSPTDRCSSSSSQEMHGAKFW